jgi:hypothetical protein
MTPEQALALVGQKLREIASVLIADVKRQMSEKGWSAASYSVKQQAGGSSWLEDLRVTLGDGSIQQLRPPSEAMKILPELWKTRMPLRDRWVGLDVAFGPEGNVETSFSYPDGAAAGSPPAKTPVSKPLAEDERKCPSCAEHVKVEAKVCPYCHKELPSIGDFMNAWAAKLNAPPKTPSR